MVLYAHQGTHSHRPAPRSARGLVQTVLQEWVRSKKAHWQDIGPEARRFLAPRRAKRIKKFGSAGTRSAAQAAAARAAAPERISAIPAHEYVVYTDGSASKNGNCGAGAVIIRDSTRVEIACAIGRGTNSIGEMWAVGMAIQWICRQAGRYNIHIASDSSITVDLLNII